MFTTAASRASRTIPASAVKAGDKVLNWDTDSFNTVTLAIKIGSRVTIGLDGARGFTVAASELVNVAR